MDLMCHVLYVRICLFVIKKNYNGIRCRCLCVEMHVSMCIHVQYVRLCI